jgi:hypothetical protein
MSPSNETSARADFLKWWNENWPDLCPTQIALAAYEAGMARMREMAAELAEHRGKSWRWTPKAIRALPAAPGAEGGK